MHIHFSTFSVHYVCGGVHRVLLLSANILTNIRLCTFLASLVIVLLYMVSEG